MRARVFVCVCVPAVDWVSKPTGSTSPRNLPISVFNFSLLSLVTGVLPEPTLISKFVRQCLPRHHVLSLHPDGPVCPVVG